MALTLDGTTGVSLVQDGVITDANLPAGSVLQVVSTTKTDTFTSGSTSFTDITGLSLSITPSNTANKIFLMASVAAVEDTTENCFLRYVRDSTAIAVGDAAGSRTLATSGFGLAANNNSLVQSITMSFVDSPSSTSAITYKIQMKVNGGTGCINRSGGDSDAATRGRYVSTITAMEIAA